MITYNTLADAGVNLNAVSDALEDVFVAAGRIVDRSDVRAAHELADADLANLTKAVRDARTAYGRKRFAALWAVFVFAERLSRPNSLPALTDGDRFTFRFGPRPTAAQRRRVLRPSRVPGRRARQADLDAVRAEDATADALLRLRTAVDRVTDQTTAALSR